MPFIPLEVYANNPSTTVSSGGTTAPAGGTLETWTVVSSSSFPAVEIGATQFHVADPALPSEIITVANVSGTSWTVTRGAEGTAPVAHTAGFTVVQVVTAGTLAALAYSAWQFPVQAYGAQGDGKIGTGGTGTSGTATFTDSGASFVSGAAPAGDVGKVIVINQGAGGAATNPFCGTISAVNSSTSVTLSANLAATCAAAPYIYGTDDTTAINAAVSAAAAWAVSTGNYKAQIMFEPQNYMLAGLTQSTTPMQFNTQIPVPVGTQYGRKLVIDFIGVGDASEPDYFDSTVPSLQGTCLVSTLFATGQPDATYSYQSVIGGPTATTGMITPGGGFANTLVNINGITVVCPWNASQYGFDFRFLAQANFANGSYLAFAPVNFDAQTVGGPYLALNNIVSNGKSTGLAMPAYNNNDNCNIGLYSCEGATFGLSMSEHVAAQRVAMIYCDTGIFVIPGATATHGSCILYASVEDCNVALAGHANGGQFGLFIGQLDVEGTAITVIDNGQLTGVVYYNNPYAGIGTVTTQTLRVIDTNVLPGPWGSAPAAPASGTASTNTQRNTAYRDATVYLSATTITAVFTGAAATGLTSLNGVTQASGGPGVHIRVPGGHYWSATYTGSLTATWILD